MTKPEDVPFDVWKRAEASVNDWEAKHPDRKKMDFEDWVDQVARAIIAAKAEERYAMAVILQDPAAVYEKWQQGAIDASLILFGKV